MTFSLFLAAVFATLISSTSLVSVGFGTLDYDDTTEVFVSELKKSNFDYSLAKATGLSSLIIVFSFSSR